MPTEGDELKPTSRFRRGLRIFSLCLCAIAFSFAGLNHFLHPEIYMKIMPSYIPLPLEMVYFSGVFEILGGLCLLLPVVRKIAVFGLILLLFAVYPANINMALHPESFPKIPIWILYLRLPLQFLIIYWVWSCRDRSVRS